MPLKSAQRGVDERNACDYRGRAPKCVLVRTLSGRVEAMEAVRMKTAEVLKDDIRKASLAGVDATRAALELASARLRDAILKCAPKPLLGFLWLQGARLHAGVEGNKPLVEVDPCDVTMAMEYLHAVLSSCQADTWGTDTSIDTASNVLLHAANVRQISLVYSHLVNKGIQEGDFAHHSSELHFLALSSWILSRAYRYGVLESEFLKFVLEPHSDALQRAYGIDAGAIADGLQAAINSLIRREISLAQLMSTLDGKIEHISTDLNNVSRTSGLPACLLDDLSCTLGENSEFFATGPFCGTPLRTLPGRLKPLVQLDDGHYACDPYFLRDSTYRAIQRGLRKRLPEYDAQWTKRQTEATEVGFKKIFHRQLSGAEILQSVYYREAGTDKWCELDLLVMLDDVLFVVEVKGGVMPTYSPELDFEKYRAKVEQLIKNAYHQGERFLKYAHSRPEVVLFQLDKDNKKRRVRTLRLCDYRLVFPIGLTIESFVPFSAASKQLSGVKPILGKFPFVAMAIDDLFILNRFLPTAGELMHYLMVRQQLAGIRQLMLIDEADHLGLYVSYKRYDIAADFFTCQGIERIVIEHPAKPVDTYFNLENWEDASPPRQYFPHRFSQILDALNASRSPGFLRTDSLIRDLSAQMREQLDVSIEAELPKLQVVTHRRILILGKFPCLVWLQRADYVDFIGEHREAAESAAKRHNSGMCRLLVVHVKNGKICDAWGTTVMKLRSPSFDDNINELMTYVA
jgi:hypothetical protein